jgi:hypothetical protein
MNIKKFTLLSILLLIVYISGCMNSIEKKEIEELREALHSRPSLTHGEEHWPCCMLISISGRQAEEIFEKMPDGSLLNMSDKKTCLDVNAIKISEGTICMFRQSDPTRPALYSCNIAINYFTGATEKVDANDYLDCGGD